MPSYSEPCLQLVGAAQDDFGGRGGCNPLNPPPPPPPPPDLPLPRSTAVYCVQEFHYPCTSSICGCFHSSWLHPYILDLAFGFATLILAFDAAFVAGDLFSWAHTSVMGWSVPTSATVLQWQRLLCRREVLP